jgi:hypothetical protein
MPARPAGQTPVQQAPDANNLPAKTAPTAQQPSGQPNAPHKSWFDRIYEGLGGGPRTVTTADADGNPVTRTVPTSKGDITRSILAGAIHGIVAGAAAGSAPEGPAGTRSVSNMRAFAAAEQSGEQSRKDFHNAPQKQADQLMMRQYAATQNVLGELRNQQAIDKLHEDNWSGKEDFYNKSKDIYQPTIDSLAQTEKDTGEQLVAVGDRKMSHEAVEQRGDLIKLGLSPVQDGWETRTAPNGQQYHLPTYSLVKSGNVNVNKEALTQLAKTNSAVAQLFDEQGNLRTASGDSLPLDSTKFINYEKEAHAATIAYEFVHQMQVGLGVDEKDQLSQNDFNKKFRDNPALTRQSVDAVTTLANAHTQTTEHALSQLQNSGQAGEIFKLLGKSPDEVGAFLNGEELKHVTAKSAAVNAGKPMTVAQAETIVASPTEPPARKAVAQTLLDVTAKQEGNVAEAKQNVKDKTAKATQDKTDADLTAAAQNMLNGDYARIGDVVSYRGNQRTKFYDIMSDAAIRAGKDPRDYSPAALKAKSDLISSFASGKDADQLVNFNTFLGHADDAMDTTATMRAKLLAGAPSPLLNKPLNWIEKNAANDPDYTAFITSLEPVRKEFMTFLNQNRAEHESDLKVMNTVLDDNATPAQIERALKQLGNSASIRLNNLGRKYSNTMGTAYPHLITPEGVQTLQKMGITIPQGLTSDGKQPAQGQPAQTPPIGLLKENVYTTFKSGQTWTLQGGKPVQIQQTQGQ